MIIMGLKLRSQLLRKVFITLSFIAVVIGLQSYLYSSKLKPMLNEANEQFIFLADERQNFELIDRVTDTLTELQSLSDDAQWQASLIEIQSELQGLIATPSEGMDVILDKIATFKDRAIIGKELILQLESELNLLNDWYYDYYGDIIATVSSPGMLYWPTSILLTWHYRNNLLETMQFNRALYLIIVGEVSAGQAILGELRTRLSDSPLRARIIFTQGRLLYGTGRYEQSVDVVQDSVHMDPQLTLAKKFLEYQLSKGPDEEMEEEEEDVQRVGTASSGGATLF